ncbi:hypothetical protein GBA65_21420 (plasmid) [Rubrobacter marinus]|uniref:Antitoxin Xre/MbcA/ParS-like toxin-binding domain-containing protein n=1 Tax=Rubrobacter marinus TaxID=2653852 RepID=A0A6G8Q3I3_9ACTN|nr:hypothetical protein [Rubrobacter marinus]QIN81008.1 hypothetical protein GBA65_21420 [Rubrobacter marinus]
MLGELERRLERYGPEERARRERLIGSLASLVLSDDSGEKMREIEEILEGFPKVSEEEEPSPAALEAARARNLLRVLEDRRRLRSECLRPAEVGSSMGVGRERLRQLREAGRLVGIRQGEKRPTLYPYWQFGGDGGALQGLEEVVRAAREAGMGEETLHFFATEPNGRLGGERPADLLRRGEAGKVAEVLRSSGLGRF